MGFFSFGGFETMFSIVFVIVVAGFVLVFAMLLARMLREGKRWRRDNASPLLTVTAAVVAKRAEVSYRTRHTSTGMHSGFSHTTYFVTFQVESGDRMELEVRDTEYGILAEGDVGRLTFQGSRYQGFERQ